jgi:hypothetical protein
MGQDIYYANQVTVAWDQVSDTGTISYEIFVAPYPLPDPLDLGTLDPPIETTALEATVSFSVEGSYTVGVRTKKSINGEILFSDINWSHQNGAATPNPFIVGYYIPPAAPLGLILQ